MLHYRNKSYLACEGPRSKDIPKFFDLIKEHRVTHLVRLTDSYEGETKKCHPYWENKLREYFKDEGYLDISSNYSVHAFDMAYWIDQKGVDPDLLLSVALRVRNELQKDPKNLLVVHCSAGVGRTGTFLASLAILDAIDQEKTFSIEEIVYTLSLQRVKTVAKKEQYITLYRLAEIYMVQKSGDSALKKEEGKE